MLISVCEHSFWSCIFCDKAFGVCFGTAKKLKRSGLLKKRNSKKFGTFVTGFDFYVASNA